MRVSARDDEWYPVLSLYKNSDGEYDVPEELFNEYKSAEENWDIIRIKILGILRIQGYR